MLIEFCLALRLGISVPQKVMFKFLLLLYIKVISLVLAT